MDVGLRKKRKKGSQRKHETGKRKWIQREEGIWNEREGK